MSVQRRMLIHVNVELTREEAARLDGANDRGTEPYEDATYDVAMGILGMPGRVTLEDVPLVEETS